MMIEKGKNDGNESEKPKKSTIKRGNISIISPTVKRIKHVKDYKTVKTKSLNDKKIRSTMNPSKVNDDEAENESKKSEKPEKSEKLKSEKSEKTNRKCSNLAKTLVESLENKTIEVSEKASDDRLGKKSNVRRLGDAFQVLMEGGETHPKTPLSRKKVKRCAKPSPYISGKSVMDRWLKK